MFEYDLIFGYEMYLSFGEGGNVIPILKRVEMLFQFGDFALPYIFINFYILVLNFGYNLPKAPVQNEKVQLQLPVLNTTHCYISNTFNKC